MELCPALGPWPILRYAGNAYSIADNATNLQSRCRALVLTAAKYGVLCSASPLDTLCKNAGDVNVALDDG